MFPFLAIFITFCLILTYYIRKNDADQQKVQDEFWEKERLANAVRKKDISKLNYITIPFEKLPVKLNTSIEKKLYELADKPMLNLTGISNTDLKLTYGTANINILSEYDTNFSDFVSFLPDYIEELLEAGYLDSAQLLLEFAIDCNADSRKIYEQLATIYKSQNQSEKFQTLYDYAEQLPDLTKKSVLNMLSAMN
ncbi:MAG: hypothetical protein IJF60_04750 [Agathobacter sp.]|nr:hypothetical protein [Agathobacter sp.]